MRPAVVSLVTGKRSYDESTARELLRQWVDQPQRLWDAVCETLAADVKMVIHVGPEPNVVPATFMRLAKTCGSRPRAARLGSYGKRAMTGMARHPWLGTLLPARAALLRAPFVEQVILENWLLEHAPASLTRRAASAGSLSRTPWRGVAGSAAVSPLQRQFKAAASSALRNEQQGARQRRVVPSDALDCLKASPLRDTSWASPRRARLRPIRTDATIVSPTSMICPLPTSGRRRDFHFRCPVCQLDALQIDVV